MLFFILVSGWPQVPIGTFPRIWLFSTLFPTSPSRPKILVPILRKLPKPIIRTDSFYRDLFYRTTSSTDTLTWTLNLFLQSVISEFLSGLPSYDAQNFSRHSDTQGRSTRRPAVHLPTTESPPEQGFWTIYYNIVIANEQWRTPQCDRDVWRSIHSFTLAKFSKQLYFFLRTSAIQQLISVIIVCSSALALIWWVVLCRLWGIFLQLGKSERVLPILRDHNVTSLYLYIV